MKINSLLVAAIVLAALSGVLYWSNHKKTSASDVKGFRGHTSEYSDNSTGRHHQSRN